MLVATQRNSCTRSRKGDMLAQEKKARKCPDCVVRRWLREARVKSCCLWCVLSAYCKCSHPSL